MLVLKVVNNNMTSRDNFKYPMPDEDIGHGPGIVVCPDWEPHHHCGNGLHGWLNGGGSSTSYGFAVDPNYEFSKWLVIETDSVVDLAGKVKFQKGKVLFVGSRQDALNFIEKNGELSDSVNWLVKDQCNDLIVRDSCILSLNSNSKLSAGSFNIIKCSENNIIKAASSNIIQGESGCYINVRSSNKLTSFQNSIIRSLQGNSFIEMNRCCIKTGSFAKVECFSGSIISTGRNSVVRTDESCFVKARFGSVIIVGDRIFKIEENDNNYYSYYSHTLPTEPKPLIIPNISSRLKDIKLSMMQYHTGNLDMLEKELNDYESL